jgi:hypothetical protein
MSGAPTATPTMGKAKPGSKHRSGYGIHLDSDGHHCGDFHRSSYLLTRPRRGFTAALFFQKKSFISLQGDGIS